MKCDFCKKEIKGRDFAFAYDFPKDNIFIAYGVCEKCFTLSRNDIIVSCVLSAKADKERLNILSSRNQKSYIRSDYSNKEKKLIDYGQTRLF